MPWVEVPWSEMTEEEYRVASKGRTYRKGRKARFRARQRLVKFQLRVPDGPNNTSWADKIRARMGTLPDGSSPAANGLSVKKRP